MPPRLDRSRRLGCLHLAEVLQRPQRRRPQLEVRAKDAVGNVDPSPAASSFTIDTAAPETTITAGPAGPTNNASPSFEFESSKAGLRASNAASTRRSRRLGCLHLAESYSALEEAATASKSAPKTPSATSTRAPPPAPSRSTPPPPRRRSPRAPRARPITPRRASSSNPPSRARASNAASTRPKPATGLPAPRRSPTAPSKTAPTASKSAPKTPSATSTRAPPPAPSRSTPPPPRRRSPPAPAGPTNNASPSFEFESSKPGSSFECRLDSTEPATGLPAPRRSPAAALKDGAQASKSAPKTPSATSTRAPPPAPSRSTPPPPNDDHRRPRGPDQNASPSFEFESSSRARASNAASTDRSRRLGCLHLAEVLQRPQRRRPQLRSPRRKTPSGNVDPSPAASSFTIDTAAPETTITAGPAGPTNNASPSFEFRSSRAGLEFECRLDSTEPATGLPAPRRSPQRPQRRRPQLRSPRQRRRRQRRPEPRRQLLHGSTPPPPRRRSPPAPRARPITPRRASSSNPPSRARLRMPPRLDRSRRLGCLHLAEVLQRPQRRRPQLRSPRQRRRRQRRPEPRRQLLHDRHRRPRDDDHPGPAGPTKTPRRVRVRILQAGLEFECRLDSTEAGDWAACTSPKSSAPSTTAPTASKSAPRCRRQRRPDPAARPSRSTPPPPRRRSRRPRGPDQ